MNRTIKHLPNGDFEVLPEKEIPCHCDKCDNNYRAMPDDCIDEDTREWIRVLHCPVCNAKMYIETGIFFPIRERMYKQTSDAIH